MQFRFQKIKGKAEINWELVNVYLSRWKDDTWFDIEIVRHQHKRSDPMRKWYFSTVLPAIAEHLGYERDEHLDVHRFLKIRYFNIEPDKLGIYRKVPSIFSDKSKIVISEKKKFLDYVIRKAAERGVIINDPIPQK